MTFVRAAACPPRRVLDQLNATRFDPQSIMLYSFPEQFITGPPSLAATGTAQNTELSTGDKRYIKKMYPR